VTCHRRRVDKVVCQEFNPATTTRIGSRHWRQADWLCILVFGEWTTTSRVDFGSTSLRSSLATAGASPLATSISSRAAPAAPWSSGAWPSTGTTSGIVLPSALAPVNKKTTGLVTLCRMDLPGPTTSVGTGTDYSVSP
jgi:hypothetical protein